MTAIDEASASSSGKQVAPPTPPVKKKRSLPGMPDPNAEVIALSPTTLLATNRFVCEICNKGFQRDQNLQLHRRGHNLPWKLRQRSGKEARKRVYVCPEPSCAHHDPSRALGDLTGIKKHFCRKHGEKKWKCDRCSKKYAVLSDWKAHSKTCGTREYRCDCGTLFSRRDSFFTHRAFCDALAEESTKTHTDPAAANTVAEEPKMVVVPAASSPTSTVVANPVPNQQVARPEQQEAEARARILRYLPPPPPSVAVTNSGATTSSSSSNSTSGGGSTSLFACLFPSAGAGTTACHAATFSDLIGAMSRPVEPPSLPLSSNGPALLFFPPQIDCRQYAPSPPSPHMSATALLQKAAEMGAAASNASLLRGFGHTSSITSSHQQSVQQDTSLQSEPPMLSAVLGLGLPYEIGATGLPELMMGPSSLFGPKPPTLDLLGLGMGHGSSATGGLSALITSIGSGLDMGAPSTGPFGGGSSPGKAWEVPERKPSSPAILL